MAKKSVKYVDGFVLVVKKKDVTKYKKLAKEAMETWMKFGALGYKEFMGEDLKPENQGCPYLPFPKMVQLKPSETVWFSYIEYESKTHRNKVNKAVNKFFAEKYKDADPSEGMPFDMQKMAYGGFKLAVGQ